MHTALTKRWPKFSLNSKHTDRGIKIIKMCIINQKKKIKNNSGFGGRERIVSQNFVVNYIIIKEKKLNPCKPQKDTFTNLSGKKGLFHVSI